MAVRVAVVGLGMMGTTHFKAYRSIPGAEVVAVCDVSGRRLAGDWSGAAGNIDTGAAGQADLSGLRTYDNFARLLRDKDVDVVDLCVPTFQHAPMAVKALRAGRHVFSEKPMAVASRSRVKVRILTAGEETYLTLDGQRGRPLHRDSVVEIAWSDRTLQLVSSPRRNYFDLLHEKLGWG